MDGNNIQSATGVLKTDTFLRFMSAFWPLLVLSSQVLTVSARMMVEGKQEWRGESIIDPYATRGTVVSSQENQSHEYKYVADDSDFWGVFINSKENMDGRGDRPPSVITGANVIDPTQAKIYLDYRRQQCIRKSCLICMGLLFMLYGMILSILGVVHFNEAIDLCANPDDNTLQNHLELLTWSYCSDRVYPFTGFDDLNDIPCQCRNLYINSDGYKESGLNATVIAHVFKHFYSLHNVAIYGNSENQMNALNLTKERMNQRSLRSVSITDMLLSYIDDEGVLNWKSIEFLQLNRTYISSLPNNTKYLTKLKYLNLEYNHIDDIDWICDLKQIQYLNLQVNFMDLPSCIYDYEEWTELKYLYIGFLQTANVFNYKLLSLPNLLVIDALFANIDYTDFPQNASWFHHNDTKLELQWTPLCQKWFLDPAVITNYSWYLAEFVNSTGACDSHCDGFQASLQASCPEIEWQNGLCNAGCDNPYCGYDGGDCDQLCDFEECNGDSFIDSEDECNELCNTPQCRNDWGNCLNSSFALCVAETSCEEKWIDGPSSTLCDEYCNNALCYFDNGYCDSCITGSDCQYFWGLFSLYANQDGIDYLFDQEQVCETWELFGQYIIDDQEGPHNNCTDLMNDLDLDGNQLLNIYEISRSEGFLIGDPIRARQVNCSICCDHVLDYYKPWTFEEMHYWTNTSSS